jgi:hypothetical protein
MDDMEPSMAELDLEECPGEYQTKTTEKGIPKDAPKEQGEYPGIQTSKIQPAVNYGNHQEHQRYEEGRWTQPPCTPQKDGLIKWRLYEEKRNSTPERSHMDDRIDPVPKRPRWTENHYFHQHPPENIPRIEAS